MQATSDQRPATSVQPCAAYMHEYTHGGAEAKAGRQAGMLAGDLAIYLAHRYLYLRLPLKLDDIRA
jgi:hypothetical protein